MSETEVIQSLYRLAETCPQQQFQHQALDLIQQVVQFDAVAWGESAKTTDSFFALRAYMYNLPAEFYNDLGKVDHLNPAVKLAFENPGTTIHKYIYDRSENFDERFVKVIEKYDLPQTLTTVTIHDSELFIHAIGVCRNSKNSLFTETDRQTVERIVPHLLESFRLCRRFSMQRKLINQWEINRGFASCDLNGVLHDADDSFIELLKNDWPDWKTADLPSELAIVLTENILFKSNNTLYRWVQLDDLFLMVASKLDILQELSEREFQIAFNFSQGRTYKEIAEQLSIAPDTVRNHLANIYVKLDLDSKEKLVKLFQ